MGTITNNDGEFSIKVKNGLHARQVEVSHIGYLNGLIPVNDKDILECTVLLEPNMNTLSEVIIRAGDPRYIVEEAIEKVNKNYITTGSMLTGFYRETAQKAVAISIYRKRLSMFTKLPIRTGTWNGIGTDL